MLLGGGGGLGEGGRKVGGIDPLIIRGLKSVQFNSNTWLAVKFFLLKLSRYKH